MASDGIESRERVGASVFAWVFLEIGETHTTVQMSFITPQGKIKK